MAVNAVRPHKPAFIDDHGSVSYGVLVSAALLPVLRTAMALGEHETCRLIVSRPAHDLQSDDEVQFEVFLARARTRHQSRTQQRRRRAVLAPFVRLHRPAQRRCKRLSSAWRSNSSTSPGATAASASSTPGSRRTNRINRINRINR